MDQRRRRALVQDLKVLLVCRLFFILAAVATPAVEAAADTTARFGGVYRRPLAAAPASLDPARTSDIYAYTVVNQVFEGLVQFDEHLNPMPALAGFWDASLDGQRWTFYLRQGVKFHHGREVTAEDVVYSFTRLLDPAVQSPVANLFKSIRGAEDFQAGKAPRVEGLQALNRYILQISLREPYTPFLSILAVANAKVVPWEEVERLGEQFGSHPVGSGPFRFVDWEHNKQIVLRAYESYYEGRPFLDQIVFKLGVGGRFEEDFAAFLQGELEETIVPSTKAVELRNASRYRSYLYLSRPTLHLLYIGFNTQKAPLTNPKVRQALNYAVDRQAIVQGIRKGGGITAHGILPPGMPGYTPDLVGYSYDPQRAKQLLAEAGYPRGEGMPILDLWFSSKEDTVLEEMEAYRKYLAELGITVEVHQAPDWPAFQAMLEAGKPALFRLAWHSDVPDPDNFFYPLLFSQSKTNRMFYHNPQVDRLLEEARREPDYMRRIRLYRTVEQLVVQEAPCISQHHRVFEYLYQPYVQGIESNALGAHYISMKKVWFKEPTSEGR
jgi:oligopeptide transport system substrate-binding protein